MSPTKAIKILYCCSNAEKDEKLRDELEKHLKILQGEGVIETWHSGMIRAGQEVEGEFYRQLAKDKFLSSEPVDELQPGEKVIVQKVEIFTKSTQTSPYIILRAQIRKCDRTCQQKQAVNKIPN